MSPKLLLINPVEPDRVGLIMAKSHRFPPLGLGYIAALTPNNWEVSLIDENIKPFEYQEADLVGLTAFTSAAPRAYEIAGIYREHGIHTVMGGIHASMLPEEALHYVDTVVMGEAESVWLQVINDFTRSGMQHTYQGSWLDLAGIVHPRRDLFSSTYRFGLIQTSRGCPMDCEFCSVSTFNGRRYRQRPVHEVLDELETIPQKLIFFIDDNIIGYGKEARAIELFKGIIQHKIKKQWWCQATVNVADNEEVLEYAARAGCRMIFIGIEAEDANALRDIGKTINLKRNYEEVFRRINHHRIAVLAAFIMMMDTDTAETIQQRSSYAANTAGVNAIQMSYLTPLPGTRLFTRLQNEGRLFFTNFPDDWRKYDFTQVVHRPKLMPFEDVISVQRRREVISRAYSYRTIWRKFFETWRATRSFITTMWAYQYNLAYRKVAMKLLPKKEEIPYYR